MREIKFRAWSEISKNMYYSDAEPSLQAFFVTLELLASQSRFLMQYTGLKDKNGKEIYEGDIVRAKSKFVCVNYEVYWEERLCQFRLCANHDKQYDKTHDLYIWADEVIGNIYENPELLERK